jgi:hypothetical protein
VLKPELVACCDSIKIIRFRLLQNHQHFFSCLNTRNFWASLREWGTQRRENLLTPNSLWRISLTAGAVVRKYFAIMRALAKGYFWRNTSTCGPKVRGRPPTRRVTAWKIPNSEPL